METNVSMWTGTADKAPNTVGVYGGKLIRLCKRIPV